MIWKPKAGQRVVIRYAKKRAQLFPYHNRVGVVVVASSGACAVNVMVRLDDDSVVVVPRGNLVAVEL